MELEINKEGQTLHIAVSGVINSITANELENKLTLNLDGITKIVFDFLNLKYLSSSGLRILVGCSKRFAENMVIRNVNETVMDIFRMTGLSSVLNIKL